jgi:peptide deformylase
VTTTTDPAPLIDAETGLLPLRLIGDSVLMARAARVVLFDDALARLVEEMFRTMYAAPGVGLAAPQVGVGLRLFTYDVGGGRCGHVCNPVLTTVPGELQDDDEGCLSVPGLYFPTPRAMEASVTGVDCDGSPVEVAGRGLLARCLQHETDHLDGSLYLDRLGGKVRRKAMAEVREAEWYGTHVKPVREQPPAEAGDTADESRSAGPPVG